MMINETISSDIALEKIPIENGQGCSPAYLFRVEKAVWVPINVFSPKWSTVGALAVRFRILSKKNNKTGGKALF